MDKAGQQRRKIMAWSNSFDDKPNIKIIPPAEPENQYWSTGALIFNKMTETEFKSLYQQDWSGIDLGSGDCTILTTFEDGKIKHRVIPPEKSYNNVPPTHDPYTNPDAHIYYECSCGAILDPQTKSFAQLNNCASNNGWKIRFGETGYTPYCVKCGEGLE